MMNPKFSLDWTTGNAQMGVDVVRAGIATFVNSSGDIANASSDTQRVDWSTGTAGLIVEETRTNLFTQSNGFDTTAWTRQQSSVTANAGTSPDGTNNAFRLVEDITVSSTHTLAKSPNITITANTTLTISAFVKADQRTFCRLWDDSSPTPWGAIFNLSNGTIGTVGAQASASILALKNGWYRCSVTYTNTSTTSRPRIGIANSSSTYIYTGNGVGSIFVYGGQFEAGSSSTSYIPTTSSTVTRNADVATITGANFSNWWQAGKGGVLVQARPGTVSGIRPWLQFDDGTANEIIALRGNTTNPELYIVDGGTPQAQIDVGTIAANTNYSMTAWWSTNDCKARLNSGVVFTDTSANIPTVTQARLGSDGTNYLNGKLTSISYYDTFSNQIYTRRKNKVIFSVI